MIDGPWSRDISEVLSGFGVEAQSGLGPEDVSRHIEKYGKNTFKLKKKVSLFWLFFKQFCSPMVYILAIASGLALFLGEIPEAIAILGVVILNSIISFFQEYKAENSIEALSKLSAPKARVIREGRTIEIHSELVLPGDILDLQTGDYIAADGRVVTSHQLAVDESMLTGESLPVKKKTEMLPKGTPLSERSNMVFGGTSIARGSARVVVTATGDFTEIGKIASLLSVANSTATPLQQRLEKLSRKLLLAGSLVIMAVVLLGLIQERAWSDTIMSALSLAVAVIPEGLPAMVTIALVVAVNRMSKRKALIRKLDAVETLGSTDYICTDKTGTLTSGKMVVRETYVFDRAREQELLKNMALCNNASLSGGHSGDTTEIALLQYLMEKDFDYDHLNKEYLRQFEWSFDSDRKMMSVAVNSPEGLLIYVKGASEAILSSSKISSDQRDKIEEVVMNFSRRGMRVLAFARRSAPLGNLSEMAFKDVEADLEFIGLAAMADPPRNESFEAIKKCQSSGIKVVMITGDHPETAAAIAEELGILKKGDQTMSGKKMDTIDENEFHKIVEKVTVYARVLPEHKLRIVHALKKNGHVVAMTGDGVNDAPALKHSNIGVAMGKGGTEVARQASSMVLTDDNFSTIVSAVEEGRAVHGNIKRTLQYLLSTNMAELIFVLSATIIALPVPLLPAALLWVNLVTDGLPSLALVCEKVPEDFLNQSERTSSKTFFDRRFYIEMIAVGMIIGFMGLWIFNQALMSYDLGVARGHAFSFLVYSILFRSLACRSEDKTAFALFINWPLLLSVFVPVLFQMGLQHWPMGLKVFRISALTFEQDFMMLLLGLIPVTLLEVRKLIFNRNKITKNPMNKKARDINHENLPV